MLHQWLNTEPPPQTAPHRVSKKPRLAPLASAPNSLTAGIRAVSDRRARAVSASADNRKARSSEQGSEAAEGTESSEASTVGDLCDACGRCKVIGKLMRLEPCNVGHLASPLRSIMSAPSETEAHR
jgi:hypothetical protein